MFFFLYSKKKKKTYVRWGKDKLKDNSIKNSDRKSITLICL